MTDLAAYGGLFMAAFIAATFLPAQSEAVLVSLLLLGHQPAWALVFVASIGNVLGACLNWLLGRYIEHWRGHRWFPVSEARLSWAQAQYRRHGRWLLLASWVPIIGDPITVVAGLMRESFGVFVLLVALAKTGRYIVLAVALQAI
ncbi:MAG: YqaA family protein [Rhodocyclaceae bacterium]